MTQPNHYPTFSRLLLIAAVILTFGSPAVFAASSISQFGITWTFDRDYKTGQFANGDYWVVGPVKITHISPKSTTRDGVTMHGSMINPKPNMEHGFDSRVRSNPFSATKNVARSFPITVQAGSSLLSAKSYLTLASGNNPQLETIAVLTVLDRAPAAGSFRPPYAGTDKTIRWNTSNLDYSKLRSVAPVANVPSLSVVEANFERPFIDLRNSFASTYLQPKLNHPAYGREISHQVAGALLSLQLNYTNAQKQKLLVRLVQRGIDIHGLAKNGGLWGNDGGHRHGRKPVLMFTAAILNDLDMFSWANAKNKFIFQEDQQTWYITSADVGRILKSSDGRQRDPYTADMIGLPEWGGRHTGQPEGDAANWDCHYRNVCGSSTVGTVLAMRMMGLEGKWNWPALFDYIDRYYKIEASNSGTSTNQIQPFVKAMWQAYRGKAADFTIDNTSTAGIWQNQGIGSHTGTTTVAFTMVPSQAKMEGITGISASAADAAGDLAASVRFAPSGFIEARNGSTWQAANTVAYSAGIKYRVVISANLATHQYSVTVTPAGGSAIKIASNWNFHPNQASISKLTNLGFVSLTGAHSVLNVSADSGSGSAVVRVNAGGSQYTDRAGNVWSADRGFNTGYTAGKTVAIANTEDDKLFHTNRYNKTGASKLLNYRFSVTNGSYRARLLFAETGFTAKGKRVFDVKAEGRLSIDNLDIFARVGANAALIVEVPVEVSDGAIDLQFIPSVGAAQINAIEIIRN